MTQTIYTQITHDEGKCSGCINVYYEAGDDRITATCNQCGADLLKRLAAHYEPVPEPPAEVPCRCDVEMFGRHCDDCPNAWAEARQERERSAGRIDPQRIAQTNHNIKEQLKTAAPHRATIAARECQCGCRAWYVTIDGNPVPRSDSELMWRGTEAEAKAKLESLRGGK